MKKIILVILASIAALLVLLIGWVVFFLVRLDPNVYKATIASAVEGATGHELHLDGNISVTFYPWLGVTAEKISIGNAPFFGNTPLLEVDHAEFRIKTWPLLHNAYEIDTIKVSGARANLQVNEKGNNNWTLTPKGAQVAVNNTSGNNSSSQVNKFVLSGVDIHDIHVTYDDRKNKNHVELDNVTLQLGELVPGKPFKVAATLRAKSQQPQLQADIKLDGSALYQPDTDVYTLHPLQLDATLSGATVPGGSESLKLATGLEINNRNHSLELQDLQMNALDLQISSNVTVTGMDSSSPSVKAEFSAGSQDLSHVMRVLGHDDLATRIRSLDSKFSLKASFDKKRDSLSIPTLKAQLLGATLDGEVTSPDGTRMQGHLQAQGPDLPALIETIGILSGGNAALTDLGHQLGGVDDHRFGVKMEFTGDQRKQTASVPDLQLTALGLTVKGSVNASDLNTTPRIEGKLSLPPFNARELIQKLKPGVLHTKDPKVLQHVGIDAEVSATANSVTLKQMTLVLDDTRIKGNADISDLVKQKVKFEVDIDAIDVDRYLAPTETTTAAAKADDKPAPLPLAELRKLDVHGALKIGKLTVSGLKLADIQVPFDATNGVLALAPMKASLYGGNFNGKIGLDATGNDAMSSVTASLSKIDLGPLEQDLMHSSYIAGKGNVDLALQAMGNDSVVLRRNLNGNGKLMLEDGVLSGTDIGATLMAVETMIRARRMIDMPKGGDTHFNNFSASLAIKDGVVHSDDLLIKAPGWQVGGTGTLANLRNETLDFTLTAAVDPTTSSVGSSKYDIGGHKLPINCSGALTGPRCLPDVKAILSATLDGMKDSIKSLFKSKVDKAVNDNGAQQPPGEAKPAEKPADKAINLLKGVFKR